MSDHTQWFFCSFKPSIFFYIHLTLSKPKIFIFHLHFYFQWSFQQLNHTPFSGVTIINQYVLPALACPSQFIYFFFPIDSTHIFNFASCFTFYFIHVFLHYPKMMNPVITCLPRLFNYDIQNSIQRLHWQKCTRYNTALECPF